MQRVPADLRQSLTTHETGEATAGHLAKCFEVSTNVIKVRLEKHGLHAG